MDKNKTTFLSFFKKLMTKKQSEHEQNNEIRNNSLAEDFEQLLQARDMKVGEIMIPRADLVAISNSLSLDEIKYKFAETGFLRLIIYGKDLDDTLGFIHLKDLFKAMAVGQTGLDTIVKKTIYAAKSTKCFNLFEKMKQEDIDIAVILDEYGGIEGVISIERLMEQIINTVRNSHDYEDHDKPSIQKIKDNIYIVDARTAIQKVEELFEDVEYLSEEEGEYETIGGFILSYLDRVPTKGEILSHIDGLEIEILESTSRAIKKVKITQINNIT